MNSVFFRLETYPLDRVPFLLAELRREPWACSHVASPAVPDIVCGERNLSQLENEIYEQAARARELTKRGVARRIRASQHVVAIAVASFPFRCDQIRDNSLLQEMLTQWTALNLDFAEMQWGEQAVSAVLHTDESNPHLHIVVLPANDQMLARPLHVGYSAQRKADTEARSAGATLAEAHSAGRNAYKNAMRQLLDEYHESVGKVLDFARRGVGTKRLPRATSQAMKHAANVQNELALEKRRLQAEIDDIALARSEIELSNEMIISQARQQASDLIHDAAAKADAAQQTIQAEQKKNEATTIALAEREAWQKKRFADAVRTLNFGMSQIVSGKVGIVDGQLNWPTDVASVLKKYEHLLMPIASRVATYENNARKILADAERRLNTEQYNDVRAGIAAQFPRSFRNP